MCVVIVVCVKSLVINIISNCNVNNIVVVIVVVGVVVVSCTSVLVR